MGNKEDTIVVIVLVIVMIGIISYAFIDHTGVSEIKAQALVINHVAEEYNITKPEIAVISIDSISFKGYDAFNMTVSFQAENKTHNNSYIVNANNGNITQQ